MNPAAQLEIFQRLTAAFAAARTLEEIGSFVIDEVRPALGAEVGVVAVLTDEGRALRNVGFKGVDEATVDAWREYPLESPVPMAEAARTRRPVVVRTIAERNRRYPVLAEVHGVEHGGGVICFPLLARGGLLGSIGFCFATERAFEPQEQRFLQALADQCAAAVERARWFELVQREIDARRSAEARLDAVLQSIDDHLACYDREWRYTFVNDPAARVLGKTKEELLGRSIWELFPDAVGNQYYRELHQAVAEGRSIRSEHYYAPFDTWFENRIYPTAEGVTVFSADVTWRKRAEVALREADRRKDEFLAMLAHELRNPLAPLASGLELLQRLGGTAAPQVVPMMARQLGHLTHLVDDLLDLSRITEDKIELRKRRVDLAAALEDAAQASRPALERAGHAFTLELPAEPLAADADPTRLAQVLGNLLGNAARYTPAGGRISLALARDAGEALITVQDSGIGIEPALLPRIFDMFAQGAPAPGSARTGLGIGLTIAKRMVELHGGTIVASSDGPGRGSRFVVRLPLAAGDSAFTLSCEAMKEEKPVGGLRVLVADDNADAAAALAQLLRVQGMEVRIAADGVEALALAEAFRPHAVLLDLGMPRMDGTEAARRLRAREWGGAMVLAALTGWGAQDDVRRSREAGFDYHLVKPVTLERLEPVWIACRRAEASQAA